MLLPTLVTGATALTLITKDAAKAHLRVDHTDEDALIEELINAAESYLDGYSGILGRALLNQTWAVKLGEFFNPIRLPVGIASSITTVKYYDTSNVEQTLASTVYQLLTDALGSYVSLKPDQSWPSSYSRADAITVTWVAGYGAAAADVPAAIRLAMKFHIEKNYDRDPASRETLQMAIDSLIALFRRGGL